VVGKFLLQGLEFYSNENLR